MRSLFLKIFPSHTHLPLFLTGLSMVCSYQTAKLYQWLFGFPDPMKLSLPLDIRIPFLPGWAWVYIGAFFFWAYIYITVARDSAEAACNLAIADLCGKILCLLFFLFLPTTNTRPVVSGNSPSELLMKLIYAVDSPTNLFPSLHCFVPWLGTRCLLSAKHLKHKAIHCSFAFIGTLLVFASTLFTKQHVFVDILGGVAVAEFGILVARLTPLPTLLRTWIEAFHKKSTPD